MRCVNIFFFIIFERERERESESMRASVEWGRAREGDTESEAGSRLGAVSPESDAGLKLVNREIMT